VNYTFFQASAQACTNFGDLFLFGLPGLLGEPLPCEKWPIDFLGGDIFFLGDAFLGEAFLGEAFLGEALFPLTLGELGL